MKTINEKLMRAKNGERELGGGEEGGREGTEKKRQGQTEGWAQFGG